jgi:hypothetical protein
MADKNAPPSMASGADRISALPDKAVRTAVLACSWRGVWMRSPIFNITDWGTVAMFTKFVFRMLRRRNHRYGSSRVVPVSDTVGYRIWR